MRAGSLHSVVDELEQWIAEGSPHYVCCASVHLIECAQSDPNVAAALANASLVTPDGAPVAWAVRRLGKVATDRVTGSDLFQAMCGHAVGRRRHFLYGSTDEVLCKLQARLKAAFPGVEICGAYSPPFGARSTADEAEDLERINSASPDIVWVALGAPKQELWMMRNRPGLTAPVLAGVGAAFDFFSGDKRRAPRWAQRVALEWVFRLAQEPRRLMRRYLVTNTSFAVGLLADVVRGAPEPGGSA